jgi:hypothetical protein
MVGRPRTYEEVMAAEDPQQRERIERARPYRDPAVERTTSGLLPLGGKSLHRRPLSPKTGTSLGCSIVARR